MEIYSRKFDLIEDCINKLSLIKKENPSVDKYRAAWKDKDSSERNIQKVVEAIIDIGKIIISERKLREPSNNREVFIILEENNIFPSEYISLIDKMIGMRNIIVHSYDRIDDSIVYNVLENDLSDIEKLTAALKKACFSA
jgi:uncharacterized protein YutE (UPF0331/DUF86 family)